MTDEMQDPKKPSETSRRDFIAMSVAASLVAAVGSASAAGLPVVESNVTVKTPDGTCDAAFIHPNTGAYPGVLIWTDAFGLRPSMRDIGKRIASEGYSVLVPNPFYRVAKAPVIDNAASFNFQNPADAAKLQPLMGSVNAPGNAEKDAVAYIAFLDAQSQVNKSKKIGTQGYCMGGPLVVKTCAVRPDRVGAGGSFHGGGLVTDKPDSPHLLAPKIKGEIYFACAEIDKYAPLPLIGELKSVLERAGTNFEIEIFPGTEHGFAFPQRHCYHKAAAETHWERLFDLFGRRLR